MISSSVGFYTSLAVMSLTEGCGNMLWRRASLLTSIPSGWFILIVQYNHTYYMASSVSGQDEPNPAL